MRKSIAILALAAAISGAAQNTAAQTLPETPGAACQPAMFENPVIRRNCPDPTVIDDRARSGWFYLYSTQTSLAGVNRDSSASEEGAEEINLPIYRSHNLIDWEFVGDGFPDGRPNWVKDSRLWAPDINYIDGKYVLYYALGVWAGIFVEGCGVAVSDSPEGPFVDQGRVVDFKTLHTLNTIDPNFYEEDGRRYLFWGSLGGGIFGMELSPDGMSVLPGAKKHRISARNTEAAYIHKHGEWYYMFASRGKCCEGENSTYHVIVARSKSILGPYKGKEGERFTRLKFPNVVLQSDAAKQFVGPGHNAEIITDDIGHDWMLYHSYWQGNSYKGRCLMLNQIFWDEDGWPYFDEAPSTLSECPVFSATR